MLRVQSILQLEKLWTVNKSSLQINNKKQSRYDTGVSASETEAVTTVAAIVPVIEEEDEQDATRAIQQESIEIEETEIINKDITRTGGQFSTELIEIEESSGIGSVNSTDNDDSESQEAEASQQQTNKRDSKVSNHTLDAIMEQEENVIKSLDIDNSNASKMPITDATDATDAIATSSSPAADDAAEMETKNNASSILSTTSSSDSSANHPATPVLPSSYEPKPRTASLLRRETQKLNNRRKSLTNKLKKAIKVKSSGSSSNSTSPVV